MIKFSSSLTKYNVWHRGGWMGLGEIGDRELKPRSRPWVEENREERSSRADYNTPVSWALEDAFGHCDWVTWKTRSLMWSCRAGEEMLYSARKSVVGFRAWLFTITASSGGSSLCTCVP